MDLCEITPYILPWKWLTFGADQIQDGWLSAILIWIIAGVLPQKVYVRVHVHCEWINEHGGWLAPSWLLFWYIFPSVFFHLRLILPAVSGPVGDDGVTGGEADSWACCWRQGPQFLGRSVGRPSTGYKLAPTTTSRSCRLSLICRRRRRVGWLMGRRVWLIFRRHEEQAAVTQGWKLSPKIGGIMSLIYR